MNRTLSVYTIILAAHLPGYVPSDLLPGQCSNAKSYVHQYWCKGFGLPVLEAMDCGAPVIISNVSSLPEVARDAALLVDLRHSEQLAEAIETLHTTPSQRSALREVGLDRVCKFTWATCAAETTAVYQRVLT